MTSMKSSEWAMLAVLSVFWGGSFFFIEVALRGFQPFAIVFLRVVLAAIILTGVVHFSGRRLPASPRMWGAYFVMGALNNAIPFSLIVWGQTRIDSGMGCIFLGLMVIDGRVFNGLKMRAGGKQKIRSHAQIP